MDTQKKLIIGGGIIGLCSAWYMRKKGYDVTVVDQGDLKDGCSTGNAGMIVPSHIIPLAAPGMISKGIRWMLDSKSPFYIRPRLSGDLITWGWHFYKSATQENVAKAIPVLKEISLLSKSLYHELAVEEGFNFGYEERGLLMLYKTVATEHEEIEAAKVANQNGIAAHVISPEEVQQLEPDVKVSARGGVYFPGDAHLIPQQLMTNLKEQLGLLGVEFILNTGVKKFVTEGDRVKAIHTSSGILEPDEVILAAGSWSGLLCAQLGISLPMQGGKGYSFTMTEVSKNVRIPTLFLEARVAVTPMGNMLRFGGTMEIAGVDHSISMNRVKGIVDSIPEYYPEMKVPLPAKEKIWHGLRPCSPDGLPYIGRMSRFKNVIVATGHSMMGISLGAATGKLVEEIVSGDKLSMPLKAFDPERFNG